MELLHSTGNALCRKEIRMTEGENPNAKLDVYLSLLDVMPATKNVHRKAILGFFPLLLANGRNIPLDDDYDDYRYFLLIQKKRVFH